MDETSSGGVDTETDTEEVSEGGCGEDTEGGCTETERGCSIAAGTTGWSPELLGVLLVIALGRWRNLKTSGRTTER